MSDHRIPGHDGIPRPDAPLPNVLPEERDRYVTPDGMRLAGWWQRLLGYVVDVVVVGIATSIVMMTLQVAAPSIPAAIGPISTSMDAWPTGLTLVWVAVHAALSATYAILMLTRLGWTLGKRLAGTRVRHREHERLPTTGEAVARWLVQLMPVALGPISWIGTLVGLWTILDGLWPLWHRRRQAVHDLVAGTAVVLAR